MAGTGLCCSSLQEPKALMKMGLSVILVGHVNFLLAALVHGVVLRHINLHKQARAMEYAISNVVALTAGLVGVMVGVLTIILSKNRRRRSLTWAVFVVSLLAALMAAASAVGLIVSVVRAVMHGGRSLLTHCRFPDAVGSSSVTNECPFDPTRIYSTTLILWVPLIVTCLIQLLFSARCFTTCVSFLDLPCCPAGGRCLPCCPARGRSTDDGRAVHVVHATPEPAAPHRHARPPRGLDETPPRRGRHHRRRHDQHPTTSHNEPPRRATAPPRQQPHPPPLPPPRQHHSLSPAERQPLRPPLRPPHGHRSARDRQEVRAGGHRRAPEQHRLLQHGAVERSSFWI